MYKRPLVPDDFLVPLLLETAEFRLRPLTVNDIVKDYDACGRRLRRPGAEPIFRELP